jgi:hypothetical protein
MMAGSARRVGGTTWRFRVGLGLALLLALAALKWLSGRMSNDPLLSPPQLQILHQAKQIADDVEPDAELGFRLAPDTRRTIESWDYSYELVTDSRGFPNRTPWPEHADLVVLGDSLVVGEGVAPDEGFVQQIAAVVAPASVRNLGIPGAGPARQIAVLRRYGPELGPSRVVACWYLASDLDGDVQFHEWLDGRGDEDFNTFRLAFGRRAGNGERLSGLERRLQYQPLYLWAQSLIEPMRSGERRYIHRRTFEDGSVQLLDRAKIRFARHAYAGTDREILNLERALDDMRALSASLGAELLVVLIPSKEELFAVGNGPGVNRAVTLARNLLQERGVPFVDLYAPLRDTARSPYFMRDIHLNAHGNAIAAQAINAALTRLQAGETATARETDS